MLILISLLDFREKLGNLPGSEFSIVSKGISHTMISDITERSVNITTFEKDA